MLMNEDLARDRMRELHNEAERFRTARRQAADPRASKLNRRSVRQYFLAR